METKKILAIVIIGLLILSVAIASVSAEPIDAKQDVSALSAFWNNVLHNIGSTSVGAFTVVGTANSCGTTGGNANQEWSGVTHQRISSSATGTFNNLPVVNVAYSCSGTKYYDYFDHGWTPYAEFKDSIDVVCNDGPCNVEVYCCPKLEPVGAAGTSQCLLLGKSMQTKSCPTSVNKGGTNYYFCPSPEGVMETQMPYQYNSYNYCYNSIMQTKKCYYKSGGTCNNYNSYDPLVFPNSCESYKYEGANLYSSSSACLADTTCTINRECPTGQSCSGGTCQSSCTSVWVAGAWSSCSGGTQTRDYYDSSYCATPTGTKPASQTQSCSVTCVSTGCASKDTISCGTSFNDNCGTSCGTGTKDCAIVEPPLAVADPVVRATISDVRLADANGNYITSDTELQPGQTVTVKFKVRTNYSDFALRFCDSPLECIMPQTPFLGGTGFVYDSKKEYNIEAGIIPAKTSVAWFGSTEPGIFSLFSTSTQESQCCENQPNIIADKTTYTKTLQGKTWEWLTSNPESYVESEHELVIKVPDKSTIDLCPISGKAPSVYWDSSSKAYVLYIDIKNGCYAENGVLTGYTQATDKLYSITLNINGSVTSAGDVCEINADCGATGTCIDCSALPTTSCTWLERNIQGTKKCSDGGNDGTISLADVKKISLTKEQISKSTTETLISSACLYDAECIPKQNYSVSCNSVNNLRADGTLSEASQKSFFSKAKSITGGTVIGATAGVAGCFVLAGTVGGLAAGPAGILATSTAVLTNPALLGTCAAVGGLFGGTGTGIAISLSQNDELVKKLNADDAASVGICTAEPVSSFNIQGFLEKIGKAVPIPGLSASTSGAIVLVMGILLLVYILSILGGRK